MISNVLHRSSYPETAPQFGYFPKSILSRGDYDARQISPESSPNLRLIYICAQLFSVVARN